MDHHILLAKLDHYGVHRLQANWCKLYLADC